MLAVGDTRSRRCAVVQRSVTDHLLRATHPPSAARLTRGVPWHCVASLARGLPFRGAGAFPRVVELRLRLTRRTCPACVVCFTLLLSVAGVEPCVSLRACDSTVEDACAVCHDENSIVIAIGSSNRPRARGVLYPDVRSGALTHCVSLCALAAAHRLLGETQQVAPCRGR